jgi:hypothetical protein
MRQRRPSGRPKKCIFCGGGGERGNPMTGEHLWSEWMHPLLPKLEDPKKDEFYRIVRDKYSIDTIQQHTKRQQGHTYTKTIKVVCRSCNTGWMSAIEEKVKPDLIPILQGQPVTLDTDAQLSLATWVTLKILVIENEYISDRVIQPAALRLFRSHQTIPRGTKIWIAYHDAPEWYAGYGVQSLQASTTLEPPIIRGRKNIQAIGFGVGHLFAFSYLSTLASFEFDLDPMENIGIVRRLWLPRPTMVTWPMRTISGDDLDRLAHFVEHIIRAPFSAWRE